MITITSADDPKDGITDISIVIDAHKLKMFIGDLTPLEVSVLDKIPVTSKSLVSEQLYRLADIASLYELRHAGKLNEEEQ